MSTALQLICSYSNSDQEDNDGTEGTKIAREQLNHKPRRVIKADEEKQVKPVIELKSVTEDIEKWKEARRKRFPKVLSKIDLDNKESKQVVDEVTSNSGTKTTSLNLTRKVQKRNCSVSRGGKRKMNDRSSSSQSSSLQQRMVTQRKLTLFEKVTVNFSFFLVKMGLYGIICNLLVILYDSY